MVALAPPFERRLRHAFIHLALFVPILIGVAVVGNPAIWLGALGPIGTLAIGLPLAGRDKRGRDHLIVALEFSLTLAIGFLATFVFVWSVLRIPDLTLLVPVGILAILMLTANLVLMSLAASTRAFSNTPHEHPVVIPLRHRLGRLTSSND